MPNDNRKQKQTSSATAIAIGVGVGAVAAVGGYLFGKLKGAEEARSEATHSHHSRATPVSPLGSDEMDPKKVGKEQEATECGICFRDFESIKANNEEVHTTPCGHVFCKHCIQSSLRRKEECPYCRQHVELNQTLRIYL